MVRVRVIRQITFRSRHAEFPHVAHTHTRLRICASIYGLNAVVTADIILTLPS